MRPSIFKVGRSFESQESPGRCLNNVAVSSPLETQVQKAVSGDAKALQAVVLAIKDDIYSLALRMLWHPADAEDATQDVLTRVCTSLSSFEGRSSFRTWVYRVAVRSLLNRKRGRVEPNMLSFEMLGADLAEGLDPSSAADLEPAERELLKKEVRIGCTQAMLLCLDRNHRMTYLLGDIFEWESAEAADCLEITPATYRKRLSRARSRIETFVRQHCGLVSEVAPCRCQTRIQPAIAKGRVDPKKLLFARHPVTSASKEDVEAVVDEIGRLKESASLFRNPRFQAPPSAYANLLPVLGSTH